ncbi:hypothetical protein KP509_12G053800 [Ceratopteris richardii]|uniref:RRM domain-containing protein n=1 Tax=Ceratopteris richardii TaxID=49495 RepID=A0A8T2TL50_CERRI|nr:hypothetical protein KP509_12G053800 [Ceratopteris richardii]
MSAGSVGVSARWEARNTFDFRYLGSPSISPKGLVSGDDKELHNGGEDSVTLSDAVEDLNEYLASFRSTLIAKRTKEYNLTENSLKEDSPRKKLSFGRFSLGENRTNIGSESSKKGSTRSKRERSHEAEDKGVEKITALVLDDPVHMEEKVPPVGMGSTVTKKRGKADDVEAPLKTDPEELNLCKVVLVENLPLNATKKDVVKEFSQFGVIDSVLLQPVFSQDVKKRKRVTKNEEVNKVAIHQSAHIVYEDEQAASRGGGRLFTLGGKLSVSNRELGTKECSGWLS